MTVTTIAGHDVQVDEEGFMTDPAEWNEEIAAFLAKQISIDELGEDHWKVLRFLREDFEEQGETATIRRVGTLGGVSTKELYQLFPKKPGRKMSYIGGVPKPHGCV